MIDKFRAWDKALNEWYGQNNKDILTFVGFSIFGECTLMCTPPIRSLGDLEITQSTGQSDNSTAKTDIYEGDILFAPELNCYVDVYFEDGSYNVLFPDDNEPTILTQQIIDANYLTVAGNIYENPELLRSEGKQ